MQTHSQVTNLASDFVSAHLECFESHSRSDAPSSAAPSINHNPQIGGFHCFSLFSDPPSVGFEIVSMSLRVIFCQINSTQGLCGTSVHHIMKQRTSDNRLSPTMLTPITTQKSRIFAVLADISIHQSTQI